MKRRSIIFFSLLLLHLSTLSGSVSAQTNLIVSPSGNDNNIGTLDKPLQTIQKALSLAKGSADKEFNILLREGTYYLEWAIEIKGSDFENKSITIAGFHNERPIVSGGMQIYPKWEKVSGKKYQKTKVSKTNFDQLFINGEKRVLARYPNYKGDALMNGTAEDAIAKQRVRSWSNPIGGFIHALHAHEWGGMHYIIEGKDADELVYKGGFQNNRPSAMHPRFRYVENIFEELDAPGEWFIAKEENMLYYYPHPHERLNEALVQTSNISSLIELRGTPNNPIRNVTIKNILFSHTHRTFMGNYEPLLRSDWQINRSAALFIENVESCKVEHCEFANLGGNAIFISGYAFDCSVKSNHIHHIGASAISLVGHASSLRSPSFEYGQFVPLEEMDTTPGPKSNLYPRQCTVEDNLIHNIGEVEKQVAGVQIQIAAQLNILHNTIYKVPRAAINVGDGAFGGHVIEHNDAFETVLETSDHGAFNSWGRDRFWHPNYQTLDTLTSKHSYLILLDALYTTIIRNNRFSCNHGWDIDLDDGSTNYHIYNNLCLTGGIKLREGYYRTVENNILINNTLHPHVWFKNSGDVVQRNIMMSAYRPIQLQGWGKKVDYNFFQSQESLHEVREWDIDSNSIAGELSFRNPESSDFTVVGNQEAFQIGFENFPMDQFGVYSTHLKELALQPTMPVLIMNDSSDAEKEFNWINATVRAISGLGDRSAFGLPDETGVVVLTIQPKGTLADAGILPGDVIRSINDTSVKSIHDLFTTTDKEKWKNELKLTLFRNQELVEKTILLKR